MHAASRASWSASCAMIELLLAVVAAAGCAPEELLRAREDPSGVVAYVSPDAACAIHAIVESDVASYIEVYIAGTTQPVAVRRKLARD